MLPVDFLPDKNVPPWCPDIHFVKGDGKKAGQACRIPLTGGQDAEVVEAIADAGEGECFSEVAPDGDPGTEGSVEGEVEETSPPKVDLFDPYIGLQPDDQ